MSKKNAYNFKIQIARLALIVDKCYSYRYNRHKHKKEKKIVMVYQYFQINVNSLDNKITNQTKVT